MAEGKSPDLKAAFPYVPGAAAPRRLVSAVVVQTECADAYLVLFALCRSRHRTCVAFQSSESCETLARDSAGIEGKTQNRRIAQIDKQAFQTAGDPGQALTHNSGRAVRATGDL